MSGGASIARDTNDSSDIYESSGIDGSSGFIGVSGVDGVSDANDAPDGTDAPGGTGAPDANDASDDNDGSAVNAACVSRGMSIRLYMKRWLLVIPHLPLLCVIPSYLNNKGAMFIKYLPSFDGESPP